MINDGNGGKTQWRIADCFDRPKRAIRCLHAGILPLLPVLACLVFVPSGAQAAWKTIEKVETYAITGASGAELYASIGEQGPTVGKVRAIAHTKFTLTWSRKYENIGSACVLTSALPKLTIIYTLPKAPKQLPSAVRSNWDVFLAGVRSHERVHGVMIEDMVREIETVSVGLSVPNDPDCRKIRADLTKRLSEISQAQRQKSRDFDRSDFSQGGSMRNLILGLVNGR